MGGQSKDSKLEEQLLTELKKFVEAHTDLIVYANWSGTNTGKQILAGK
jgi:hypothetical protein